MTLLRDLWSRETGKHLVFALLAGFILRLFFVLYLPVADFDTILYEDLSHNVVQHHAYAYTSESGDLVPADVRVPGYPLFLSALYIFFGDSQRAIFIAQILVDLATCILVALLAASLAPERSRKRVEIAALWLGATCPFVANYTAAALTEVLATFLTTAALLFLVWADQREPETRDSPRKTGVGKLWFFGGVLVGFGALVRPEVPIMLAAPALVLAARWYKPADWPRLARAGILLAAGLLAVLSPWAVRNWITLHKVQFLTARNIEMPGSYIPLGFYAWTHTWMVSCDGVDQVFNKLEHEPLQIADFPAYAFDSADERARVQALLPDQNNDSFSFTPVADAQFSELARERTARHPLRTYFTVPVGRSLALWFTPRTELLPYAGNWWPPIRDWGDYDEDFWVGILYTSLNYFYAGLAIAGAYLMRRRRGVALLPVFVLARTLFISGWHFTIEPRFVLECVPAVLALAALVFAKRRYQDHDGRPV